MIAPEKLTGAVLPPALSRSAPAPMSWTPGSADEIWIWLSFSYGSGERLVLWCTTADTGSFTIPAAAMAWLPTSFDTADTWLIRANVTPVSTGSWMTRLVVGDIVSADLPLGP